MAHQTNVQTKITGRLALLSVLLSLFSVCTNASVQSGQNARNELPSVQKKSKKNIETIEKIAPHNGINLIAEQDPNGIYWGLRNTVTGKLVSGYKFQKIWNFEDGFATILQNGKYGLINKSGKIVIAAEFDSPKRTGIECGYVSFEVGYGPVVIVDTTGKAVMEMQSGISGILPCQKRITLGNDRYGMINFNGDTILPFKFREAYLRPEGFCVASNFGGPGTGYKDLYGLYDLNGKQILPHVFDKIDGFYCGRAIVEKSGKHGVIDKTGKELFYMDGGIDRFSNNYAVVHTRKDGETKAGIIDTNGKEVVPAIYQWLAKVYDAREGIAAITQNRKYGFVDITGKIIVPFKYDRVQRFENGIAEVWVGWRYAGYVDRTGKEIIPPNFEVMDQANLRRYYDKFIIGLKDSVQHVFDYSGKETAILKYETVKEFDENEKSFIVSIKNKYGILDSNFRVKIPAKYQSLEMIFPGKIAAREHGKIGFIDNEGKALSTIKYDSIEPLQDDHLNPYDNGLALVGIKGKKGLINSYGKIIIPVIYDEIENFYHGRAVVKRNGKYGFVNIKGKEVIPAIYSEANAYDGQLAEVTLKGKTFLIDSSGKRVEEDNE